jgi:predicted AlkP superfamily phosphohydrolase/phosphomutase/tetratricopeptide (TPR) repeat protein
VSRLLLVGWDGADWKVINPLLAQGELPHLATVLENGVHGNLATIYPSLSPLLWTSIATGKRPYKHGILGFIEPTPDGMGVRPVSILGRTSKAVWNILSQSSKRSIVVGWWPSHPAEPIRGAMVSNHFRFTSEDEPTNDMGPGTVWPKSWVQRLTHLRVHPTEVTFEILQLFIPDLQRIDQEEDKCLHDLAEIIANMMSIHAASTDLIQHEQWDFAAVYFDGIDQICHRFMPYHARKQTDCTQQAKLLNGVVNNAYRYQDAMLGRLIALGGKDCAVMVISDHGFHSDHLLTDHIAAEMDGRAVEHRNFGIFCLRAPDTKPGATIYGANILDIAPTLLHIFGLPIGQDMDGRVLLDAFLHPAAPQTVPSWDAIPGNDGQHAPNHYYDASASTESLRQLVALGYIAPPSDRSTEDVSMCIRERDYNLACCYLDGGQPQAAIGILRDLLRRNDEDGRFYQLLATALLLSGDLTECARTLANFDANCARFAPAAQEELAHRRSSRPDSDLVASGTGDAWIELRWRQHLAEQAMAFVGERLLLHCRLAAAQTRSGASASIAKTLLDELSKRFGSSREVLRVLAECYMILGDQELALTYILRLKDSDPLDWQALALESRIQYELGNNVRAMECCVESLSLVYNQPILHYLLGLALRRLGENSKAEEEFRIAASLAGEPFYPRELIMPILNQPFSSDQLGVFDNQKTIFEKPRDEGQKTRTEAQPFQTRVFPFERFDGASPIDRSRTVTIVTGLPRSGTSMMMQMLVRAGLVPFTDGRRAADQNNPRGYFEHELATHLHEDNSWLSQAQGKVVKIIAQLLTHLPSGEQYWVIFMHRDMDEVIASQYSMLKSLGQMGTKLDKTQLARVYSQQLARVQTWLQLQLNVHVLAVQYADALKEPENTAARLACFLGKPFDELAATAVVESALRHHGRLGNRHA